MPVIFLFLLLLNVLNATCSVRYVERLSLVVERRYNKNRGRGFNPHSRFFFTAFFFFDQYELYK